MSLIVEVRWCDSMVDTRQWLTEDEAKEAWFSQCVSVGKLLDDSPERIILAAHFGRDGEDVGGVICIPKACVTHVRELCSIG